MVRGGFMNLLEIKLLANLGIEIFKAIKKAKKDNELETVKKDPNTWLANHFGGVRTDTRTASSNCDGKS